VTSVRKKWGYKMDIKITTTKKESDEVEQATYYNCELSVSSLKNKIFIFIEYTK